MNPALFATLLVAIGFGGWPLVARLSGVHNAWATTIVMSFTTIVTGVVQFREMAAHPADVNLRTICLIAVPCIMNAGAMLLYSKYVMPSSVLIAVMVAAMMLVPIIGGRILFGDVITTDKVIGMSLALGAVYFLNR
mgnify:CR=1 FL=1